MVLRFLVFFLISVVLSACGQKHSTPQLAPAISATTPTELTPRFNQLGYQTHGPKWFVIPGQQQVVFEIQNSLTGQSVLRGYTSTPAFWPESAEWVSLADVSALQDAGSYRFIAEGITPVDFVVAKEPYAQLHNAAIKAFYYNRASLTLEPHYAGIWARTAGHPDTLVKVHASAASANRPAGFVLSAPKGWYDAGDYNKYVVNSGITTYTLLRAWTDFSAFYRHRQWQIPESVNAIPDLLDEIMWNLDWLSAMQDPHDGGVYHKLTTLNFAGIVMPEHAVAERYVVQKSTAAALNFAAVLAKASRTVQAFDTQWPGKAATYRQQALAAWQWAQRHPALIYQQPDDVKTGEYGDKHLADEWAWAGVELFLLTGESGYLQHFTQLDAPLSAPSWASVAGLAYYSLLDAMRLNMPLDNSIRQRVTDSLQQAAAKIVTEHRQSAYRVAMQDKDFVWGSNAVAMNKAMLLYQAWRLNPEPEKVQAMHGLLDYVLGRNPLQLSYVTGFGQRSPQFIHHRPSAADDVAAPVPGWLVGGPQPGQQDQCTYIHSLPALSYLDDWCSYASNEVAINWNAPLVYMLAALHHLGTDAGFVAN